MAGVVVSFLSLLGVPPGFFREEEVRLMLEKHEARRNRRQSSQDSATAATPGYTPRSAGKGGLGPNRATTPARKGMEVRRYFTKPNDDGFTNVEWELRTAAITGES